MPPLRRRAYDFIEYNDNAETTDVATNLGLPTTTTRRILEDLAAHGLIWQVIKAKLLHLVRWLGLARA